MENYTEQQGFCFTAEMELSFELIPLLLFIIGITLLAVLFGISCSYFLTLILQKRGKELELTATTENIVSGSSELGGTSEVARPGASSENINNDFQEFAEPIAESEFINPVGNSQFTHM